MNLSKFVASVRVREFYPTVTIRFQSGKVTLVEAKMGQYKNLPEQPPGPSDAVFDGEHVSVPFQGSCGSDAC